MIYISIFYIFNLSPSALFTTTKFWFFISNTLVFIIAADFIAFSSSKDHDYYDEYISKSSKGGASPPFFDDKSVAKTTDCVDTDGEEKPPLEKIINMVDQTEEYEHNDEELQDKDEFENDEELQDKYDDPDQGSEETKEEKSIIEKVKGKSCVRSNSDKGIIMAAVVAEGEKLALQRTLSERWDEEEAPPRVEENEFSRMSDEELNRRVEDFIRRFNRQIRLQAVRNGPNELKN